MLAISVENLPGAVVVACSGRLIRSDAVFQLRDTVMAQMSPTVVLDLSEVKAIGGGGLGMLAFLQHWAGEHGIKLKLFSPSKPVVEGLTQNGSMVHFKTASFAELMGMLLTAESEYRRAA